MENNLKKIRPEDSKRININEAHEVQYWTTTFGITKEELVQVLAKVGTSVKAVKDAQKRKC